MIQANELRIGNLVRNKFDEVDSIHSVQDIFDQYPVKLINSQPIESYDPIPLTPEILEKCGFIVDDSENDFHLGDFRIAFHIHDGVVEWQGNRIYEFIPPLHQLQNLYFALNNTELEINL